MAKLPEERIQILLKQVITHFDQEDRSVRERQIRTWRQLKLLWENYQRIWFDEVAHDWRIWDETTQDDTDQAYYDKPINIFRAYLESIIAALSVTVPPVKCFPDDANNTLDLTTARAGDKISQLIYRHNNVPLLWLHALFTFCTEGLIACYSYPEAKEEYGTYEEKKYEDNAEEHQITKCPECEHIIEDVLMSPEIGETKEKAREEKDKFGPDNSDVPIQDIVQNEGIECPACLMMITPLVSQETVVITRLIGKTRKPKSRINMDVYGGLYVKVPVYARKQCDCPYLQFNYECSASIAVERYSHIHGKLTPNKIKASTGPKDPYEEWGRLSPQYQGEYPLNVVTVRNTWLRPSAFNVLNEEADIKELKKKYPNGAKVVLINDEFADAVNESLDDHWTLSYNPMSDYLHHDPLGLLLVSVQEITNDLISLVIQTIEHGIPQTFADPGVLNFNAYRQQPTTPGAIYEAVPKSGRSVGDAFHEVKTATLSHEVMPFSTQIQSLGQLVSGALPSLFGGDLEGSRTASQYSMSRAQALQRQQNTWKMLTAWWTQIFGKVIPMYIKEVKDDERDVQRDKDGNFINILITKAELEGKIGKIELDANENLPITWGQQKDVIMNLFQAQNPKILEILMAPENLPYLREALGLTDVYVPGEDDRNKQYDEIRQLLNSEPSPVMPDEEAIMASEVAGLPLPEVGEESSVPIDPIYDNHAIEFEICRKWITSEEGRQTKFDNAPGYRNVLLHGKAHYDIMQQQMMQQAMAQAQGGANPKADPKLKEAPITGEGDVLTEA
jgi:hypothetical protein